MIVVVTVPFLGHYTASRNLARKLLLRNNVATLFVVLSWKDFPIPVETDRLVHENRTIIAADYALQQTDPTEFNWQRAEQLIVQLQSFLSRLSVDGHQVIDTILYDFFCVEAHVVARLLRLRSICCIPAIPEQFLGAKKSAAIARIEQRHGLAFNLSSISDFLFINDADETKWLFCSPALWPDAAYLGRFSYVNLSLPLEEKENRVEPFDVYVCLGTVVTGNLWQNATRAFKQSLIEFYMTVCNCCEQNGYSALVCIPGDAGAFEKVSFELKFVYGRCRFVKFTDQKKALRQCRRFFITHGGGNSVSESIECRVPMLCVPFFGDQYASASLIHRHGFGISFCPHADQVVTTTSQCLSDIKRFIDKISFINGSFAQMVAEHKSFRDNIIAAVEATIASDPEPLLDGERRHSPLRWVDGDLLFGASEDRKQFCANVTIPGIDFCFGRPFDAFSSRQRLATLMDHYNDILYCAKGQKEDDDDTEQTFQKMLQGYANAQPRDLVDAAMPVSSMEKQSIARSCIAGLDYFLFQQSIAPQCVVHFIIGNDFFNNGESVAHDELEHIRNNLCASHLGTVLARILFYVVTPTDGRAAAQQLVRVDPREALWFQWSPERMRTHICTTAETYAPMMKLALTDMLSRMAPMLGAAPLEHRVKSADSLLDNFCRRKRFVSSDIVGFRIVHPFTNALFLLTQEMERCFRVVYKRVSERGRVIHLLVHQEPHGVVEVQLWPSVLHSCFEAEHDTVYKQLEPLSAAQMARTATVRTKQHAAQDLLDQFGPIIQN